MESSDEPSSLQLQLQQQQSSSSSLLHDVLGSATAGIISRIMTHPLDTVKARLQAHSSAAYRGPIDALMQTYRREGIRSLYGGFGAVIVGGTPGTVLYLTGYAFFRDTFTSLVSNWGGCSGSAFNNSNKPTLSHGQEFAVHFSSGMLAEAVTCIIYVPVDVIKERMQVQSREGLKSSNDGLIKPKPQSYHYNGSLDALQQIIRTEGLKGIYRGYWATLASFGPFSALYFVFYERCKVWSKEILRNSKTSRDAQSMGDGDLPLHYLIACSAGAGALASWLTSPLDMAKLRLQVQRGQTAAAANTIQSTQYRGMFDCLQAAYKKGELFRGAGARVLHFAPATTVTMTAYEKCKNFYADALPDLR